MSLSLCCSPGCYGLADESSGIKQEWIGQAIETPGVKKEYDDGTRHYIRQIPKFDNRWLRVIIKCFRDALCSGNSLFRQEIRVIQ
jgi:hypothetical protein